MPETVTLTVDGKSVRVASGSSVAAAVALAGEDAPCVTRQSVGGQRRGPVCGMGVCQECRVTIDGVPHQLACQTVCAPGMDVVTGVQSA
ncbi:MAG: (2Fe-2S)-binding protein [Burkholderiaceae bacterium]|nr:(2Fe-2S)-binding protein [Burkholderiaceae bacterium]